MQEFKIDDKVFIFGLPEECGDTGKITHIHGNSRVQVLTKNGYACNLPVEDISYSAVSSPNIPIADQLTTL